MKKKLIDRLKINEKKERKKWSVCFWNGNENSNNDDKFTVKKKFFNTIFHYHDGRKRIKMKITAHFDSIHSLKSGGNFFFEWITKKILQKFKNIHSFNIRLFKLVGSFHFHWLLLCLHTLSIVSFFKFLVFFIEFDLDFFQKMVFRLHFSSATHNHHHWIIRTEWIPQWQRYDEMYDFNREISEKKREKMETHALQIWQIFKHFMIYIMSICRT